VSGGGPSVSVALCTHNGARFVEEQVRSILGQSVPPVEIVLSDDASTDDTVARVVALVEPSGVRLTVLSNVPALGVTRNFEQAILACTGEIIALSDQDDVWHPDRLERVLGRFAADPGLLLLHGDAVLVDERGEPLRHTLFESLEVSDDEITEIEQGRAFAALLRRNLVTGATAVFRRALVDAAVPFPAAWVHDEWLAVIAATIGRVGVTRERLVDYRQHGANEIGAQKRSLTGKVRRLLEPRTERNARLEARAAALVARLESWGSAVRPEMMESARAKLRHEIVRNSLPRNRVFRVGRVVNEARAGGYALYGRGTQDVARDLLQSAS
jgi:glycosyltransferase involved in cell wall biosynthesis